MTRRVILASASPRRRELLSLLIPDFEVVNGLFDESTVPDDLIPLEHVVFSAKNKAESILHMYPDAVVIGADTIVSLDEIIMGKPSDQTDAVQMLKRLSGKTHQVYTGLAVVFNGCIESAFESTDVVFSELCDDAINRYVADGEPMDKAGAYGIQGKGAAFIEKINGCYFNVVGLPVYRLSKMLHNAGVETYL